MRSVQATHGVWLVNLGGSFGWSPVCRWCRRSKDLRGLLAKRA